MEGAQGASNNSAKHKKRKSAVQRWRPISTEAAAPKGKPHLLLATANTLTQDHSAFKPGYALVMIGRC